MVSFHHFTLVRQARVTVLDFENEHVLQRSWLLATLATCYSMENQSFSHTLCGKQICRRAFLKATSISQSRYYEVRKCFIDGQHQAPNTSDCGRFHIATELALQWLRLFANENGDKLPDREKIMLPCSMTKTSVYEQYAQEYSNSV